MLRGLHEIGIEYRRLGSAAVGLVRVADGIADLYFEAHLNSWDVLAGALNRERGRRAGNNAAVGPNARRRRRDCGLCARDWSVTLAYFPQIQQRGSSVTAKSA